MKKFISILLALVLTVSLLIPVGAEASNPRCMVMLEQAGLDATVVKGEKTYLNFFVTSAFGSGLEYSSLIVEIYKGGLETVMEQDDPVLVEEREYSGTQFSSKKELTMTWTADSRYSVGDYTLICYLIASSNGYFYDDQAAFCTELHVLSQPCPATDFVLSVIDNNDYSYISEFPTRLEFAKVYTLLPTLLPYANTSNRTYKITDFDTDALGVAQMGKHGYIQISGKQVGTHEFSIDFGTIKKTFRFEVYLDSLHIYLTPENTILCPGQTDKLTAEYIRDTGSRGTQILFENNVAAKWSTSDANVVRIKDGIVTAVGPGTATITVTACGVSESVTYTVHPHDLPADTPTVAGTATQPTYQEGLCSICGEEHARNILVPPVFTDTVATAWYAPHVDYVYENGIMNGVNSTTFAPSKAMTRAMVATVLYRIAGSPEVEGEMPFTDVPEGTYYTKAVLWAAQNGIVNGYADGTFLPNRDINREQLATILYRYTESRGVVMNEGAELSEFPDEGDTASYAGKALCWAVGEGLVTGVKANDGITYLRPKNNATRAQFAPIISRYMTTEWEPLPEPV